MIRHPVVNKFFSIMGNLVYDKDLSFFYEKRIFACAPLFSIKIENVGMSFLLLISFGMKSGKYKMQKLKGFDYFHDNF